MANSADPDQKPTDLDLHCLQRQSLSGFSRTRVKTFQKLRLLLKERICYQREQLLLKERIFVCDSFYYKNMHFFFLIKQLIFFTPCE